jgi:crotonobetainyl-CoA:carnitine CoA-transferase CaiB-like acyl-CoA transferase
VADHLDVDRLYIDGRFSDGPDADRGGYDILGYWSRSGIAAAVKSPDDDDLPPMPGPAYGDSIGAMTIAGGISAALLHRARTRSATGCSVW